VDLPRLTLPLRPALSMSAIVEVAVRDALQRRRGVNAAARLDESLREEARRAKSPHGGGA